MHKILVIRLHFPLDALHVSDYISLPGCCVAIATQQPDVWYRQIPACTKCDVQLVKVAPEDGLIQSETCTVSNGK